MPNQVNRLIYSARYGIQQAIQTYRAENFVAEIDYDWDSQTARMARYWHNRRYVDNTIYATVNRYAAVFKFQEKLYKHIRGLYNPTGRLVDIESAKILGGAVNYETFEDGALQIVGADDRLLDAIRTQLQWSHFEQFKTRLTRDGGSMGDVAIKLVDDIDRQKICMEVLDPRKIPYVEFDNYGSVKFVVICYEKLDPISGQWYEYKEEISKERFKTYKDGTPFDYEDMSTAGTVEWANPYGFVPLRWIKHRDVGLDSGATSFHNARHKIDMVNDALSLLLHNVRMQVSTKFSVSKVNVSRDNSGQPVTMNISTDRDDQAPFIEVGEGEIKPIVFPVAVSEALELAAVQMREIESDLPQLSLQRMRSEGGSQRGVSGIAIENLYNDAADVIAETQANYYAGLKAALQMGISMGAYRGYPQFRAYNPNSYEAGALDFDIRPKPLFQDKLSTKDTLELAMQAIKSEGSSILLPKLGFTPEQIEELEAKKDETARQNMRAAFSNLMGLDEEEAAVERLQDGKKQPENEYA
jgi:hypothetical protein